MKLVWSRYALGDRDHIFSYIETQNPRAAFAIDEQISAAVHRLLDFPESGRTGRVAGTRELVIAHTPYIAAYAITVSSIRILRILHGAQIWPEEFDDQQP